MSSGNGKPFPPPASPGVILRSLLSSPMTPLTPLPRPLHWPPECFPMFSGPTNHCMTEPHGDAVAFSVCFPTTRFYFHSLPKLGLSFCHFSELRGSYNLWVCVPSESLFRLLKTLLTFTCFQAFIWPTIVFVVEARRKSFRSNVSGLTAPQTPSG